jgi:hypothetical protein
VAGGGGSGVVRVHVRATAEDAAASKKHMEAAAADAPGDAGGVGGAGARDVGDRGGSGGLTQLTARFAVVAIPPRVAAARVTFLPPLPSAQLARMMATATWAGDWCKVVASFKTPFWRENGDSGAG